MAFSVPQLLYDNRLADGAVTATTTTSGYSAANLTDWRSYTYWKPVSTAVQYITVDCTVAKSADALGIFGHDLFTRGAALSVEASSDNFATDVTVALNPFAVPHNGAIYRPFTALSKRYWRIKITGLFTPCYIAIAAIGNRLVFDAPIDGEYTPAIEDAQADVAISVAGQMLGAVPGYREISSALRLTYVDDAWFRGAFTAAWNAHLGTFKPFFFAPDYDGHPADIFLYRIKPGFTLDPRYHVNGRRQFSLDLVGTP